MVTEFAAHCFALLTAVVVTFQIAVAAGAPWGHLTLGGRHTGQLPPNMRGVPVISAVLLVLFALVVWARAGVLLPQFAAASGVLIWGVVAYCALGVVANAITPSRWERTLWLPVVTAMLACSLVVALGG